MNNTNHKISGKDLIDRYRKNYGITDNAILTEEMILKHWELEKKLTRKVLATYPETRWDTFEECYSTLYRELEWLNKLIDSDRRPDDLEFIHSVWLRLIGPAPKKIYEIGSGKGELIKFLAAKSYTCKGSEITRERGGKWAEDMPNITWGISDGVHLEKFEPKDHYDVVITDQVIEHLHPDNLIEHFRGVYQVLVKGGRYILRTPHIHVGPSDISKIFECEKPMGLHLKEYSYRELVLKLRLAGFNLIMCPLPIGKKINHLLDNLSIYKIISMTYLMYLFAMEILVNVFPNQRQKRKAIGILSKLFFPPNITLVAEK